MTMQMPNLSQFNLTDGFISLVRSYLMQGMSVEVVAGRVTKTSESLNPGKVRLTIRSDQEDGAQHFGKYIFEEGKLISSETKSASGGSQVVGNVTQSISIKGSRVVNSTVQQSGKYNINAQQVFGGQAIQINGPDATVIQSQTGTFHIGDNYSIVSNGNGSVSIRGSVTDSTIITGDSQFGDEFDDQFDDLFDDEW